jgi:hypothetical protein
MDITKTKNKNDFIKKKGGGNAMRNIVQFIHFGVVGRSVLITECNRKPPNDFFQKKKKKKKKRLECETRRDDVRCSSSSEQTFVNRSERGSCVRIGAPAVVHQAAQRVVARHHRLVDRQLQQTVDDARRYFERVDARMWLPSVRHL